MVFWCLESKIRVMLLYALVEYVESFRSLKKRKEKKRRRKERREKQGTILLCGLGFSSPIFLEFGAKLQRRLRLRLNTRVLDLA